VGGGLSGLQRGCVLLAGWRRGRACRAIPWGFFLEWECFGNCRDGCESGCGPCAWRVMFLMMYDEMNDDGMSHRIVSSLEETTTMISFEQEPEKFALARRSIRIRRLGAA